MKKILFALCGLLLSGTAIAQKTITRQETAQSGLSELSVAAGFKVTLREGEQAQVKVEIDKELEPYLICEVKNGKAKLGFKELPRKLQNWNWGKGQKREAIVTVNSLENLVISSSSSVHCEGSFSAKKSCDIRISSSGSLHNLDLDTDKVAIACSSSGSVLNSTFRVKEANVKTSSSGQIKSSRIESAKNTTVHTSSSGSITLAGRTESLQVDCSSSGSANLSELQAETVSASASSSGSVRCNVSQKLTGSVSSSGSVHYKTGVGKSPEVSISKSSGGSYGTM